LITRNGTSHGNLEKDRSLDPGVPGECSEEHVITKYKLTVLMLELQKHYTRCTRSSDHTWNGLAKSASSMETQRNEPVAAKLPSNRPAVSEDSDTLLPHSTSTRTQTL